MKEQPLVSVIIPCYNHGTFLVDALKSVHNQSYPNVEIIVVNDGSTDQGTLRILSDCESEGISVLHIQNAGPSVARNKAIEICRGDYIVPLDADDLIRPDTLNICVPVLLKDERTAVVYGDCQYFGKETFMRIQEPFDIRKQLRNNLIALCSVIRKEALTGVGGFDVQMSKTGLEDWELWIRLYGFGWNFNYINKTMFDVRVDYTSRTYRVANPNLPSLRSYVYHKHADLLAAEYDKLFHDYKNLLFTSDYRLGYKLLNPFRSLKKLLKH